MPLALSSCFAVPPWACSPFVSAQHHISGSFSSPPLHASPLSVSVCVSLSLSRSSFSQRRQGEWHRPFFVGRFAGDEHPTGVWLPFPSLLAARNRTPNPLRYAICIRIWPYILPTNFDFLQKIISCTCVHPCPILGQPLVDDPGNGIACWRWQRRRCWLGATRADSGFGKARVFIQPYPG